MAAVEIKTKMILEDLRGRYDSDRTHFEVVTLSNSTQYKVGECLSTDTVDMLIDQGWQITIK